MVKNEEYSNRKKWQFLLWALTIILIFSIGGSFFYLNFPSVNSTSKGTKAKEKDYLREGKKYLREGQFIKAIELFEKAIKVYPKNEEALYLLAQANESIGKNKPAIEYYRRAIQINPKKADYHYNLAINLKFLKEYEQALQELKKAIQLNTSLIGAKLVMAEIFTELKRYDEAIKTYNEILKEEPFGLRIDEIYVSLGKNYQLNNNLEQAKKSWQEALKVNPQNSEAKELLAKNP